MPAGASGLPPRSTGASGDMCTSVRSTLPDVVKLPRSKSGYALFGNSAFAPPSRAAFPSVILLDSASAAEATPCGRCWLCRRRDRGNVAAVRRIALRVCKSISFALSSWAVRSDGIYGVFLSDEFRSLWLLLSVSHMTDCNL